MIVTVLLASPRMAKPGPDTIGEIAGCRAWRRAPASACHWSIERSRCARACTCGTRSVPAPVLAQRARHFLRGLMHDVRLRAERALDRVRLQAEDSAVMKMTTAMPMAVPPTISSVCKPPSRRKRSATIHSKAMAGGR